MQCERGLRLLAALASGPTPVASLRGPLSNWCYLYAAACAAVHGAMCERAPTHSVCTHSQARTHSCTHSHARTLHAASSYPLCPRLRTHAPTPPAPPPPPGAPPAGVYTSPTDSLHQSQLNKIDALIAKADIKPTDHVLEIGCGWGGFGIRAVQVRARTQPHGGKAAAGWARSGVTQILWVRSGCGVIRRRW